MLRSSGRWLFFRFIHQTLYNTFRYPPMRATSSPTLFDRRTNIWREVQITKVLTVQFFQPCITSCSLVQIFYLAPFSQASPVCSPVRDKGAICSKVGWEDTNWCELKCFRITCNDRLCGSWCWFLRICFSRDLQMLLPFPLPAVDTVSRVAVKCISANCL